MGGLEFKQKISTLVCYWIISPIYRRGDYLIPASKRGKSTAAITKTRKE